MYSNIKITSLKIRDNFVSILKLRAQLVTNYTHLFVHGCVLTDKGIILCADFTVSIYDQGITYKLGSRIHSTLKNAVVLRDKTK